MACQHTTRPFDRIPSSLRIWSLFRLLRDLVVPDWPAILFFTSSRATFFSRAALPQRLLGQNCFSRAPYPLDLLELHCGALDKGISCPWSYRDPHQHARTPYRGCTCLYKLGCCRELIHDLLPQRPTSILGTVDVPFASCWAFAAVHLAPVDFQLPPFPLLQNHSSPRQHN